MPMGQKPLESEHASIGFSCQSILPVADESCSEASTSLKKLRIHASEHFDANIATPMPLKTEEILNIRCKQKLAKLPEKKFSYRHLAQIKFIFPEAIQADKILLHNKNTLSMEPDLKVTLLFDVIEGHIDHSPYIALCHTFVNRLIKFVNTHPEGCDVPEAELPEPFNQKDITISANSLPVDSSVETLPNIDEAELLNPSHLHPSFSRHFSRKDVEESIKTELSPSGGSRNVLGYAYRMPRLSGLRQAMGQQPLDCEQASMGSSCQSTLPVADKSCLEASTPIKKPHIHESQHLDASIATPTPQKTEETLNIRCKKEPAKLPEKYGTLSEFFDRMTTSLRLLNLRKQLPTFQNICRQVETLTKRKFSYRHLAQIKFIFPEAVQADKILLHNKKTLSMEPDIKVTLLFDVIEGHIEHSPYIALCHTFFNRLTKFVNTHPEGCDVPEAELPEPFNQKEITVSANSLPVDSSVETLPNTDEAELLNPSHLHPSFSRHFSRTDVEESAKTELLPTPVSPSSVTSDTTNDKDIGFSSCLDSVKQEEALKVVNEDTPMKPRLVLDKITIDTPDLSTPKRSVPTENKIKSVASQKEMASNLVAKRSLDFSFGDDEGELLEEKTTCDRKVEDATSKNETIAQSGLKAHQDTSSCLSDLVETIHNIFCSAHCSSITKRELVHKILVDSFDVIESGEIEEQIELLVNKVPDWISKKVDPCGDFLYIINKGSDLKSIAERLM
ncbi:hypothetical protein OSB04_025561 [Centaurea solstitialis]|uniref:CDT1 Geminin-binding domain-containing protein n=1 Tax=Centaurea solstitialis TaxID=347529 RepID=A0AA38WD72_9ASTR|nr:hypothetical protein OSB04_025561 [Centaurea solstitialis]